MYVAEDDAPGNTKKQPQATLRELPELQSLVRCSHHNPAFSATAAFPPEKLLRLRRALRTGWSRSRCRRLWRFFLDRLLWRLRIVHNSFFRRRCLDYRLRRFELITQPRQFAFLGGRQMLHSFSKRPPHALQRTHVVAQVLVFIFRTKCSSRLNHLAKDVIERVQIAVE